MLKILTGEFINDHGINRLKNYKYKTSTYTFMDNAMQPWWNIFVSFVPLVRFAFIITLDSVLLQTCSP